MRRIAAATVFALASSPTSVALGERIFADGFETPCDATDLDGDRLSGCAEDLARTDPLLKDTDGDGLSDGDELLGTLGGLDLPAMGVSPRHKDILLEYDWVDDQYEAGSGNCPNGQPHSHRPTQAMLDIVTVMYGAAPVENPDGVRGIHIVHDMGQGGVVSGGNLVPDADGNIIGTVFDSEYVSKYQAHFAPNRRGYFHWVLMAHRYFVPGDDSSSGYAELTGSALVDSMMITLRCIATTELVGNTIAHELGHNLRLHHGGSLTDACNNKPNHNSIMNYRFQFDGVDDDCLVGSPSGGAADFSHGTRLSIDEAALSEPQGMCSGVPIDWNNNGDASETLLDYDVNAYPRQVDDCGGVYTVLQDHDEWTNIVLPIAMAPGAGVGEPTPQLGASCPSPPIDP